MTAPAQLASRRMAALTQAALHGTVLDEYLFVNTEEKDWNELFELSAAQGVMMLSLNGAMRLPKRLQPPHTVKLRWIAGVAAVEKRYRHQMETAEKLDAYFRENNIRMLLFKGIALSRLYPVPKNREFGDIDIFLCGKAKEGDVLLERIADKFPAAKKHTDFFYRKILIENHHTFLNHNCPNSFYRSEALEKRLMALLTEADVTEEADPAVSGGNEKRLLFPPPEFDVLFVVLHALGHLPSGIVLRHLCDLTVLFTAYKGKIDFSVFRNALSESGLLKPAGALIALAVRYLGLKPEDAPPYESDLELENRLWNDMLYPAVPPLSKRKSALIQVIIYKIRLIRARYWKYELIFPGKFIKIILFSIRYHLCHPRAIKRLK